MGEAHSPRGGTFELYFKNMRIPEWIDSKVSQSKRFGSDLHLCKSSQRSTQGLTKEYAARTVGFGANRAAQFCCQEGWFNPFELLSTPHLERLLCPSQGVWALACCYLTAFSAILTVGLLGKCSARVPPPSSSCLSIISCSPPQDRNPCCTRRIEMSITTLRKSAVRRSNSTRKLATLCGS